jgi:hypothetical protein
MARPRERADRRHDPNPDDPAVLAAHEGRGWRVVEVPEPGPFVPDKVNVNPGDVEAAWVELVHPVTGARHQFPNNPDAVAGANEAGWVAPNRDGSIPKTAMRKAAREQGVDVDDLPASQADAGDDAPEEPPAAPPVRSPTSRPATARPRTKRG